MNRTKKPRQPRLLPAHNSIKYQVDDDLSPETYAGLKANIAEIGVQVPVEIDEDGHVIDGHHRVRAVYELRADGVDVPDYPIVIIEGLADEQKRDRATQLNALRRQQTPEQKRTKAVKLLTEGRSQSETARLIGVDQGTVSRWLVDMQVHNVPLPTTRTDSKGRAQPTSKPRRTIIPTEAETVRVELSPQQREIDGYKDDVLSCAFAERELSFENAKLLGECQNRCGADTYAALWELGKDDAKVRYSLAQLKHLLELARSGNADDVTADLVTLAESGGASDVFNAHKTRQRERRDAEREAQREANRVLVAKSKHPEAGEKFKTIVLDPPWDWGDEGDVSQFGRGDPTYATMPLEDIRALPVPELAEENAHIYLWITNRSLPKGFSLLESWGFRYVTAITWVKPSFGMGNYFRGSTEHVLFGVRGSLPIQARDLGTHFQAPRPGRHSAKPPEFYDLVERASPGIWLEMFARAPRENWKVWGAESGE